MRYVFLYTELAEYTLVCLRALKKSAIDNEILVIHYPVNPEAPFKFDFSGVGDFVVVDQFQSYSQLLNKIESFHPDKIFCSGWINKWYLRVCFAMRTKSICVLTLDTRWNGSYKQHFLSIFGRFIFTYMFSYAWVPGTPQKRYAQKLGFVNKQIKLGFYSCDVDKFDAIRVKFEQEKSSHFPKRILCVARYVPAKNYKFLWEAFIQWKNETNNDWELWCVGTGEEYDSRARHPAIRHFGFIQTNEWNAILKETGVFILPSNFEPWGVVVHEFAAAGYPLLLSNKVGASEAFLKSEENGWLFDPSDRSSLIRVLERLENQSPKNMVQMSAVSAQLAKEISPIKWAAIAAEF